MDRVDSRAPVAAAGVAIRRLSHAFGSERALAAVDLAAPAGRVSALVGPPGCGKTTLLRIAAGLLAADSGTVRVAGVDVRADPRAARRCLGWLADGSGTWDTVRVHDALSALAAAHGLGAATPARIAALCELVELGAPTRRRVGDLTALQRRRLGLAQALVHDPAVLLLDAPLAGLGDPDRVLLAATVRVVAGGTRTVVVCARTLAEVEPVSDQVVTMAAGRVVSAQDRTGRRRGQRWRVLARDEAHLRAVLDAHAISFVDAGADEHGRAAVDVVVPAGAGGEQEAAGLLALLVRERTEVLAFGPAGAASGPGTASGSASGSASGADR